MATETTAASAPICGIEISARRAIFVFLRLVGSKIEDITGRQTQITIENDDDPAQIRRFCRSAHALFDLMQPHRIAIIQRKKRGHFASGGSTFKLEGLLQLYPRCDVILVAPAVLRQFAKDRQPVLAPRFGYQKNAYLMALYLLTEGGRRSVGG